MQCPKCHKPPVPFLAFNIQNLRTVTCRRCGTRLVVTRLGVRYWTSLVLGIGLLVIGGVYTPEMVLLWGNTLALAIYGGGAFLLFTLWSYFAWRDGEARER